MTTAEEEVVGKMMSSHRNYRHLTTWQFYSLYGLVWTSSLLSIVGSALILRSIVVRNYYHRRHGRGQRQRGQLPGGGGGGGGGRCRPGSHAGQGHRISVFHKLMLGLSLSDLLYSLVMMLQPIFIPSFTTLPVAVGNRTSCQMLGVGMMLVLTSYLFGALLALHFYWAVVYDNRIQLPQVYCHIIPWGTALAFGVAGLYYHSFGYEILLGICLFGCGKDQYGAKVEECDDPESITRRALKIIGWTFSGTALLAATTGVVCTVFVYLHTRKIYRNSQRHVFFAGSTTIPALDNDTNNTSRRSSTSTSSAFRFAQKRAIARRSMLYTAAFLNSFFVSLLASIVTELPFQSDLYKGRDSPNLATFAMMALIYGGFPIQGFWNSLVYFAPTVTKWRNSRPGEGGVNTWWWAIRQTIFLVDDVVDELPPPHNGRTAAITASTVRPGDHTDQTSSLSWRLPPSSHFLSSSSFLRPSPPSSSQRLQHLQQQFDAAAPTGEQQQQRPEDALIVLTTTTTDDPDARPPDHGHIGPDDDNHVGDDDNDDDPAESQGQHPVKEETKTTAADNSSSCYDDAVDNINTAS